MRHNARIIDGVCSGPSAVTVVIDAYTHNSTLTSGNSVPLGTQLILVCQVVGLPYGTKLCYTSGDTKIKSSTFTWNCPAGFCVVAQIKSRRFDKNDFILAITTISTTYSGTYTCQVTDSGGQKTNGSFTLNIAGKHHSVCSTKCVHMSGIQLPWRCYTTNGPSYITTYKLHLSHLYTFPQVVLLSTVKGDSYLTTSS